MHGYKVYRGRPPPPEPPSGVKLQDSPSSFLLCGWNDPSTKPYNWGLTAMADTLRKECSPLPELIRYSSPKLSLHYHLQGKTIKCAYICPAPFPGQLSVPNLNTIS